MSVLDAVELDMSAVGPNHSGPSPGGTSGRRPRPQRAYTAEEDALTDIAKQVDIYVFLLFKVVNKHETTDFILT